MGKKLGLKEKDIVDRNKEECTSNIKDKMIDVVYHTVSEIKEAAFGCARYKVKDNAKPKENLYKPSFKPKEEHKLEWKNIRDILPVEKQIRMTSLSA